MYQIIEVIGRAMDEIWHQAYDPGIGKFYAWKKKTNPSICFYKERVLLLVDIGLLRIFLSL